MCNDLEAAKHGIYHIIAGKKYGHKIISVIEPYISSVAAYFISKFPCRVF